jgi:UDP-N-acetylmuramoylalanine--D-glutamate ligase
MPANGSDVLARVGEEADVPSALADSLEGAVARARAMVPEGGAVLLSPGAPSGDDFADFAARGDAFRRLAGASGTPGTA